MTISDFKEIFRMPWFHVLKPKYRPNVAVIVRNERGEILLCERSFPVGAMQTVQGGIDPNENVVDAGVREVSEELGIETDMIKPIACMIGTWRYDFPKRVSWAIRFAGYRGQEQRFILVEIPSDTVFHLEKHFPEFVRARWEAPEKVVDQVSELKREGIRRALEAFCFSTRV